MQCVYIQQGLSSRLCARVHAHVHIRLYGGVWCVQQVYITHVCVCARAHTHQRACMVYIQQVLRTLWAMCTARGVFSKQPELDVSSVWCCGRSEMLGLGSLSLEPHRIPAGTCWSAGPAGQRRTWDRVVRLSSSQCLRWHLCNQARREGASDRDPAKTLGLSSPHQDWAPFYLFAPGLGVC